VQNTILVIEISLSVIITVVMGYYATKMVNEKLEEVEQQRQDLMKEERFNEIEKSNLLEKN